MITYNIDSILFAVFAMIASGQALFTSGVVVGYLVHKWRSDRKRVSNYIRQIAHPSEPRI